MTGISALSKVQFGTEAVAGGTTDPATAIWVSDSGGLTDNLQKTFPKQKIGILGGTTHSFISKKGGEVVLMGDATYQQLPYIFNSAIKHVNSTSDTGSGWIRQWDLQAVSTDPIATTDLDTRVFEVGDNEQVEIMRYAFVREWTLSGVAGEALMINAVFEGRAVSTGAFTAGISIPTVSSILFSMGSLYIDPSTDTPGTTIKSNTLLSMELKHITGWKSVMAKDNRLDFSFIKRIDDEMILTVTFEHNASSIAEKDVWRSSTGTERVIRLTFPGNALTTTGTYDTETLILDLYGSWQSFGPLTEEEGDNTVQGVFRVAYCTTPAKKATLIIVNETQTLP